jgi:hypothetical protein
VFKSSSTPTTEYCVSTANFARSNAPFVLKGLKFKIWEKRRSDVSLCQPTCIHSHVHRKTTSAYNASKKKNLLSFTMHTSALKNCTNKSTNEPTGDDLLCLHEFLLECKCTQGRLLERKFHSLCGAIENREEADREMLASFQRSTYWRENRNKSVNFNQLTEVFYCSYHGARI